MVARSLYILSLLPLSWVVLALHSVRIGYTVNFCMLSWVSANRATHGVLDLL